MGLPREDAEDVKLQKMCTHMHSTLGLLALLVPASRASSEDARDSQLPRVTYITKATAVWRSRRLLIKDMQPEMVDQGDYDATEDC